MDLIKEQGMSQSSNNSPRIDYDACWRQWNDFIRFNPGARHRRRLILSAAARVRFQTLLDVGCGNGELLQAFQFSFPKTDFFSGVDLSQEVITRNSLRFNDILFQQLDITQGMLNRTFDLVVCSEVIEHISDRKQAFANLARMVNTGGHLILTCPVGRVYATERAFGHISHPTLEELTAYAKCEGLEIILVWNWGWPIYKILKWTTNLSPEWSVRNFAQGNYSLWARMISHALYYANFMNLKFSRSGCQLLLLFQKR